MIEYNMIVVQPQGVWKHMRKNENELKIAVAGIGYVGLANAVLLAQSCEVVAVDVDPRRVETLNQRKSPIIDREIEEYLATNTLRLSATTDGDSAYRDADFVVISTPTNYDSLRNTFDTSSVESVIRQVVDQNPDAVIVII